MTLHSVTIFLESSINVPFRANDVELAKIVKEMAKPRFIRSRAYGLKGIDGDRIAIDMSRAIVMLSKEMTEVPDEVNS